MWRTTFILVALLAAITTGCGWGNSQSGTRDQPGQQGRAAKQAILRVLKTDEQLVKAVRQQAEMAIRRSLELDRNNDAAQAVARELGVLR